MLNCKGCCFADSSEGQQVGCLAKKHELIGFSKSDDFFELDRLCLYKRVQDWHPNKTIEEKVEFARKQLFPNIGICLEDDSENPEDLENVINQIINLEYPKNKIKAVIYSQFSKAGARIPSVLFKMRSEKIICSAVFVVNNEDLFENETSVFKKLSESTFLTRMSSRTKVDMQKTLDIINEKFNDEMQQILVFKNKDLLFLNKTYVSSAYLDYLDYNKMQDDIVNKTNNTKYLYTIT